MTELSMSRRAMLGSGTWALLGAVALPASARAGVWAGLSGRNEETIRKYYAGWEKKDWGVVDALLADNFTFSSAAPDDGRPVAREVPF